MLGDYAGLFVALNLVAIVVLLVATKLRPWVIFICTGGLLYLTGVLSLDEFLAGFTNPSLLVLVLLYLVSIPLERTSLLRRAITAVTSGSNQGSVFRLGVFSATLSAFVNNTAVVAAMLGPIKKQVAIHPSKLLLPLSYASILGGTLTLIGTSTNLIVNGFVLQAGLPPIGFFDFTMIGLPVFVGCLTVMVLLSPKLLPKRSIKQDGVSQEYFLERKVAAGSQLIGLSVQDNGLRQLEKIFLIEVIRQHKILAPVNPQEVLREGDVLVFAGDLSAIELLDDFDGLHALDEFDQTVRQNLIEVIVSPTSGLLRKTIKQVDFRAKFDAAVVAIRRGDQKLGGGLGQLKLQAGDSLVLAVGDDFDRRREIMADFIRVGGVETNRSLSKPKECAVFLGFAAIVILGISGFVPLVKGLMIFMGILILAEIVTKEEIKARFPLELVIVIGCALGLAQAIFQTGLADLVSQFAGNYLSSLSPIAALIGVFVLTWLMTELVTNNAAAAIMFPLAMAISSQWGDDYMPFVMAVAFGASASFLSPYGYQTNLMVYTAGNYRVVDYLKFGLPVLVVYGSIALTMISIVYGV